MSPIFCHQPSKDFIYDILFTLPKFVPLNVSQLFGSCFPKSRSLCFTDFLKFVTFFMQKSPMSNKCKVKGQFLFALPAACLNSFLAFSHCLSNYVWVCVLSSKQCETLPGGALTCLKTGPTPRDLLGRGKCLKIILIIACLREKNTGCFVYCRGQ